MGRFRLAVVLVALAGGCGTRTALDAATTGSAAGASSGVAGVGGAAGAGGAAGGGGSSSGTGGAAPALLCADDPCTPEGCAPVRIFAFDPFTEGELVAEAPDVCVSHDVEGSTQYDCFARCGGGPFMTAIDDGYASGLLLEGGALTSAVGVSAPDPFVHVVRRDILGAMPTAASPVWSSDVPFQLDNLARVGGSLVFSWTSAPSDTMVGIYRMPYAGGAPVQISDWQVEPEPHMMAVSGGVAYLSSDDPSHYGIASFDLGAQKPPVLLYPEVPPISVVAGIAVAGGRIVWADVEVGNGNNESWIREMALDGSGQVVVADLPTYVMGVVADGAAIYFTTEQGATMGLSWIPLAGGTPASLVTGEMRVDRLTQDADYLYYVGHDGVYRVRKPGG